VHILELQKSKVSCNCGLDQNNSPTLNVEELAYKHAKETFPSQIRDLRSKPHKVVRDPFKPEQVSLF
jgi:hypothetical protein